MRVLSRLFRRLFLEKLEAAFKAGKLGFFGALAGLADPAVFVRRLAALRRIEWVVFAKRPFAGPAAVLAYLGRYTHRVAIANSRLVALAGNQVSFRWRDYRHHNKYKVMTLAADEFIRRFLLHALPRSIASVIMATPSGAARLGSAAPTKSTGSAALAVVHRGALPGRSRN